jgi:hypothetical protein
MGTLDRVDDSRFSEPTHPSNARIQTWIHAIRGRGTFNGRDAAVCIEPKLRCVVSSNLSAASSCLSFAVIPVSNEDRMINRAACAIILATLLWG